MKIYTVVCSYLLDGNVINIELSKMLKRLNIQPKKIIIEGIEYGIDYGVNDVVRYNVNNAYKVKYNIKSKISIKKRELFEYDSITKELIRFVDKLNDEQARLILQMSNEEFELKYKHYGYNYISQIKGENKNEKQKRF